MKKFKDYEVALAFVLLAISIILILVAFVFLAKRNIANSTVKKSEDFNFIYEKPKDWAEDTTLCDRKRVYYNTLYNTK
jgi:hypothetical protein